MELCHPKGSWVTIESSCQWLDMLLTRAGSVDEYELWDVFGCK